MKESFTFRVQRTVENTLATHEMISGGEAVLVAVSGGPDSMALLHVMHSMASKKNLRLGVAHLNHGLRPVDADADEALVRQTASSMSLPYFTEKADVPAIRKERKLSVEEAAREVRYRFLGEVAQKNRFSVIALGHHADDNAELVLMNLLRGSGPLGLSGIPPRRPLPASKTEPVKIHLIRPLAELTREDILSYVSENQITSVTDETNADPHYLRNKIRLELMPLLKQQYNPKIVRTLNRTSQILRSEKEWVDNLISAKVEIDESSESGKTASLSKSCIQNAQPAEARRLVRMAIEAIKGNLRQITYSHIDGVLALAERSNTGSIDLPGRVRAMVEPERIFFIKEKASLREVHPSASRDDNVCFKKVLETPGRIFIPEIAASVGAEILPAHAQPDFRNAGHRTAFFDMEAVSFPLTVRTASPGDHITPLGMTGRQKIKKFFIDHKVPAASRMRCPVLESRGRLIWLMGYRIDDSVKITARTKQVLKVEFNLA